ncbi:transcriptional regulator, MarR family [Chloroherpeton thalassium ATCC 35110]|uniref:Transcriptional regulator, MarR family n=1 Tax=Chloroherpeton thalassium (strain ATCC 35110 / GB-78) TaxID=517418 RepID=B3QYK2_CHLT3|nr:MarR family transcriptional regulator [Chloroherpeton thalassium]ACF13630.1 transcriptional regulator, MarR family [Chloroherpeton thalassium ATCC 35110]
MNHFDPTQVGEAIGHYIGNAHIMLRKVMIFYLKEHNLNFTPEQLIILKRLRFENGLTQNEIAHHLLRDSASITRIIDGLEKRNLVVRKKIATDRRANQVFITEAGEDVLNRIFPLAMKLNAQFMEGLDESEIEVFKKVIGKILENASSVSEKVCHTEQS